MIDSNGDKYYLHYNQVGSLIAVSDNNIKQIEYDSYGNILNDSNPSFEVPFGFAGGLYDKETKLVHFDYRDYDPYTGKWTAKDPIGFAGGDSNLYGYVLGDLVNLVDVFGLWTFGFSFNFAWGGGIGGIIGINFVIDGHGNFQIQWIKGAGGYTGQSYSVTFDLEWSNANCVKNLTGNGYQTGIDGGEGLSFELGVLGGNGYNGGYVGIGIGGGVNSCWTWFLCNKHYDYIWK